MNRYKERDRLHTHFIRGSNREIINAFTWGLTKGAYATLTHMICTNLMSLMWGMAEIVLISLFKTCPHPHPCVKKCKSPAECWNVFSDWSFHPWG